MEVIGRTLSSKDVLVELTIFECPLSAECVEADASDCLLSIGDGIGCSCIAGAKSEELWGLLTSGRLGLTKRTSACAGSLIMLWVLVQRPVNMACKIMAVPSKAYSTFCRVKISLPNILPLADVGRNCNHMRLLRVANAAALLRRMLAINLNVPKLLLPCPSSLPMELASM